MELNIYHKIKELQIGDTDKPLKLMSSWKQLLTHYSSSHSSKSSVDDVPNLYLQRNVFFLLTKEKLVISKVSQLDNTKLSTLLFR